MSAYSGKGCWIRARRDSVRRVAFLMFERGDGNKEVAYLLGVAAATVRNWRNDYDKAAGQ